jgi:uncharacterized membrane protein YhhN
MNRNSGFLYPQLLWAYLLLCLFHIYATATANELLIYLSKPLLLSLLSIWFWLNTKDQPTAFSRFVLLGLIFSIGGDTFLMFVDKGPNFFLFGLGSFLIAQVSYLAGFLKFKSNTPGLISQNRWVLGIFFLVWLGIISFLWSGIPADLKVPVSVYSFAIVAMAAGAFNLNGQVDKKPFTWLFLGVLLFIISDSMIAINKFNPMGISIPNGRVWIMLTYLAAQGLIGTRSLLIKLF